MLQGNTSAVGKSKAQLTLVMLDQLKPLSSHEQRAVMLNKEEEEHTVVAWLFWHRIRSTLPCQLEAIDWLDIPCKELKELKDYLDLLRLAPDSRTNGEALTSLRKFGNLSGRDLAEADWDAERLHTNERYAGRGRWFGLWYVKRFRHYAKMVATRTIRNLVGQRIATLDEWWSARLINTPSGSSSHRHVVDHERDRLHKTSDRPNKRVVFAHQPDDWPRKLLQLEPHCIARCSTKPEPGRKRRALYAACDCSSVISSYASLGIENAMRWGGMAARQAPSDVLNWVEAHVANERAGGCWLSLDYSDFNKEHSAWELALLNVELAHAWTQLAPINVKADKLAATTWTAASHLKRECRQHGRIWRPQAGLFSGHRDTARDNTMLHWIYQQLQLEIGEQFLGVTPNIVRTFMCGDDEDTLLTSLDHAVLYYSIGAAAGWHFNPRKQMVSKHFHEFLQYLCSGQKDITQPLAAAAVSAVNGNWYKDPTHDVRGMADSFIKTGLELAIRQAHAPTALEAARAMANNWYRWQYGQNVRWDALISTSLRSHPILKDWGMAIAPISELTHTADNELLKAIDKRNPPGVQAALRKWWPLLELVPPGARHAAVQSIKLDAFKTWYTAQWNTNSIKPPLEAGKVPLMTVCESPHTTIYESLLLGIHRSIPDDEPTIQRVAAITGYPVPLLSAVPKATLSHKAGHLLSGYTAFLSESKQTETNPYPQKITGAVWGK